MADLSTLNPPTTLAEIIALFDEEKAIAAARPLLGAFGHEAELYRKPYNRALAKARVAMASAGSFMRVTAPVRSAILTRCRALGVAGQPWAADYLAVMGKINAAEVRFRETVWNEFVEAQATEEAPAQ